MNCLEEVIASISTERVFIQTHNFPDPDAIACAYGLSELLKAKGIDAEICYKGSIDRTVTAKMVRLLNINVKEYISFEEFNKEDNPTAVFLISLKMRLFLLMPRRVILIL